MEAPQLLTPTAPPLPLEPTAPPLSFEGTQPLPANPIGQHLPLKPTAPPLIFDNAVQHLPFEPYSQTVARQQPVMPSRMLKPESLRALNKSSLSPQAQGVGTPGIQSHVVLGVRHRCQCH